MHRNKLNFTSGLHLRRSSLLLFIPELSRQLGENPLQSDDDTNEPSDQTIKSNFELASLSMIVNDTLNGAVVTRHMPSAFAAAPAAAAATSTTFCGERP